MVIETHENAYAFRRSYACRGIVTLRNWDILYGRRCGPVRSLHNPGGISVLRS